MSPERIPIYKSVGVAVQQDCATIRASLGRRLPYSQVEPSPNGEAFLQASEDWDG